MSQRNTRRGTCCWCGRPLNAHDYWFWWLRKYHRGCKAEQREVRKK